MKTTKKLHMLYRDLGRREQRADTGTEKSSVLVGTRRPDSKSQMSPKGPVGPAKEEPIAIKLTDVRKTGTCESSWRKRHGTDGLHEVISGLLTPRQVDGRFELLEGAGWDGTHL